MLWPVWTPHRAAGISRARGQRVLLRADTRPRQHAACKVSKPRFRTPKVLRALLTFVWGSFLVAASAVAVQSFSLHAWGLPLSTRSAIPVSLSSLRMWGSFRGSLRRLPLPLVFPTRVGVCPGRCRSRDSRSRLPHMRGGLPCSTSPFSPKLPSCPHAWGSVAGCRVEPTIGLVFPTRVGVRRVGLPVRRSHWSVSACAPTRSTPGWWPAGSWTCTGRSAAARVSTARRCATSPRAGCRVMAFVQLQRLCDFIRQITRAPGRSPTSARRGLHRLGVQIQPDQDIRNVPSVPRLAAGTPRPESCGHRSTQPLS
ncbi:hypothetical protein M2155_008016 [Streptomyces sp. SAI-119]|nr:hypothetical protein [Streptomyces sp. SAI-119]